MIEKPSTRIRDIAVLTLCARPAATKFRAETTVKAWVLKEFSGIPGVAGIAVLLKLPFTSAAMRIYQVKECLNVFVGLHDRERQSPERTFHLTFPGSTARAADLTRANL